MASVTFEVEGMSVVQAKLTEMEVKVRPAMLGVSRAGAKVLVAAIKSEAPVGKKARPKQNDVPGGLRDSVKFKSSKTKFTGVTGHTIGAFGKGSPARGLVIYGHNIKGHGHSIGPVKLSVKAFGHQSVGGKTRTTPNSFVKRGGEKGAAPAMAATELAATLALKKAMRL